MENYGCTNGLPHRLVLLHDGPAAKWEACQLCGRKFRWSKGFKGRVDNPAYLRAHARNYAQPGGATNRLYKRLYHPEECIIRL